MNERSDPLTAAITRFAKTVRRARRQRAVAWASLALAVAAGALGPRTLPPIYLSQTVLLHRELVQATTLLGRDAPIETQRQRGTRLRDMLLARANLEPIVRAHGLYPEIVAARGIHEAIDQLLKDADCKVGEDTYTIKFAYRDPDAAYRVTKKLADSLVAQSARYRLEQAEATRDFLAAQRQRTAAELEQKEQALAEFLATHPEFAQDIAATGGLSPAGASIRAQQRKAAAIDPIIEGLERQRMRVARQLQQANAPGAVLLPPGEASIAPSESMSRAHAELDRAAAELAELRGHYTDAHPDVAVAVRRLAIARAAYETARAEAHATPQAAGAPPPSDDEERQRLSAELRTLNDQMLRVRQRRGQHGTANNADAVVDLETQWTSLNRGVFEVRERYQQIERRYFQAAIMANVEATGEAAQMVVIDPAFRPERPSARGPRRVAASGAALVLVLGVLAALALGKLDERVADEDDLRALELGPLAHALGAAKVRP